jgi:hypothetical protein
MSRLGKMPILAKKFYLCFRSLLCALSGLTLFLYPSELKTICTYILHLALS